MFFNALFISVITCLSRGHPNGSSSYEEHIRNRFALYSIQTPRRNDFKQNIPYSRPVFYRKNRFHSDRQNLLLNRLTQDNKQTLPGIKADCS